MELENANDLLQLSRKKGSDIVPEESLSNLSPMAAASSAILRKGMTLTQVTAFLISLSGIRACLVQHPMSFINLIALSKMSSLLLLSSVNKIA